MLKILGSNFNTKKINIYTIILLLFLLGIAFVFIHPFITGAAQTSCEWTGAGDGSSWNDKNNWSCGVIPNGAQYDVTICNTSATANTTINSTTTLTLGKLTIGDPGGPSPSCGGYKHTLSLTAGLTLDTSDGAWAGDLIVGCKGELKPGSQTITTGRDLIFDGDATECGASGNKPIFTYGTSVVDMDGPGRLINKTGAGISFSSLRMGSTGNTIYVYSDDICKNNLLFNCGDFLIRNSFYFYGGDIQSASTTFSFLIYPIESIDTTGTMDLRLPAIFPVGTFNIPDFIYRRLIIAVGFGDGTIWPANLTGSTTIKNTLEIGGLFNNSSVQIHTKGHDLTILGDYITDGTLTSGDNNKLILEGNSTVSIDGDILNPSNDTNDYITIVNGNTINVGENWDLGPATFIAGTGTVNFISTTTQTHTIDQDSGRFYNVSFSHPGTGSWDYSFLDDFYVENNLTTTDAVIDFDTNNNSLSIGGNLTIGADGNLLFDAASSTVTFLGSSIYTSSANTVLTNVSVSSTTASASLTLGSNATATPSVTVYPGESIDLNGYTLKVLGNSSADPFVQYGAWGSTLGTLEIYSGGNNSITLASTTYPNLTLNASSSTDFLLSASTTVVGNLTIDGSGGGGELKTADSNLTITGTTTLNNSAVLTASSTETISVGGSWEVGSGGVFYPASSTVNFASNDSSVKTINTGTSTASSYDFNNVSFSHPGTSGADYVFSGSRLYVAGNLTTTDATIDLDTNVGVSNIVPITIEGDLTIGADGNIDFDTIYAGIYFIGNTTYTTAANTILPIGTLVGSTTVETNSNFVLGSNATGTVFTVSTTTDSIDLNGYRLTLIEEPTLGVPPAFSNFGSWGSFSGTLEFKPGTGQGVTLVGLYPSVILNGNSNTYLIGASTTIVGDLILNGSTGSGVFSPSFYDFTVIGTTTVKSGMTLKPPTASTSLTVYGSLIMEPGGVLQEETSNINLKGTGLVHITDTNNREFYNLSVAYPGQTTTLRDTTSGTDDYYIKNTLTLNGGVLNATNTTSRIRFINKSGDVFIPNGSTFSTVAFVFEPDTTETMNIPEGNYYAITSKCITENTDACQTNLTGNIVAGSGGIKVRGNSTLDSGGYNIESSADIIIGEGASSVYPGHLTLSGNSSLSASSSIKTTLSDGASGSSTISVLNGNNILISGNWQFPSKGFRGAVFNPGTSTVSFVGSSDQFIELPNQVNFYNLTVNKNNSELYFTNMQENNTLRIGNDLVLDSGTINLCGNSSSSQSACSGSSVGSVSLEISGDITNNTSGASGNLGIVNGATSTFTFNNNSTYTNNGGGAFELPNTIVSSSTASATLTLGSNATTSGITVAPSGTLNLGSGGYVLNITDATGSSTPLIINGTFVPGTSTVYYKATSTNTTIASTTYNNLTLDDRGGGTVFTIPGGITTGSFNASGTVVVTGVFAPQGSFSNTNAYIAQTTGYIATSSSVSLDASSYSDGETMTITVYDANRNISATTTETISVTVTDGDDSESVSLTETSQASERFTGTISISDTTSKTDNNGTLEVSGSGTITVSYSDIYDSTDSSQATASVSASSGNVVAPSGGGGGGGILGFFGKIFGGGGDKDQTQKTEEKAKETEKDKDEGSIIGSIVDVFEPLVPDILKPKPEPKPKEEKKEETKSPEENIAQIPECNVFNCGWDILPKENIEKFAFAPLPQNIAVLEKKFPELKVTFDKLNIKQLKDIKKLEGVELVLPGLKDVKSIPSEVVFAAITPKQLQEISPNNINEAKNIIDFNIAVKIDKLGNIKQAINVVSGKPVSFVVKPEHEAKRVKGYLVLSKGGLLTDEDSDTLPGNSQLASLLFAQKPVSKKIDNPPKIDEEFLLSEFEYVDKNGDGIYEADLTAPLVHGEYEVITLIEYKEKEFGTKEIRFTLLVDPEGYVYEDFNGKEVRLPDVKVSIFWKNPETGNFELWPAEDYQQINPQITDNTGEYSFLVPPGEYYITAEADGYHFYKSPVFEVKVGRGVHKNIKMEKNKTIFDVLYSTQTILALMVIVLFLLVGYNFYKDKKRRR